MAELPDDVKEYLARMRKTVAESQAVIEAAELRLKETDRFLESQGLTREQVLNFKITPDHRMAVNEELRRRGLPPLEEDEAAFDFDVATEELRRDMELSSESNAVDEFEERRRKFGNLMHEFRL